MFYFSVLSQAYIYKWSCVIFFSNVDMRNNITTFRVLKTHCLSFKVDKITKFFCFCLHLQPLARYHELVVPQFLERVTSIIDESLLSLMFVKFLNWRSKLGLCGVSGNWQSSRSKKKKIYSPSKTLVELREGCYRQS